MQQDLSQHHLTHSIKSDNHILEIWNTDFRTFIMKSDRIYKTLISKYPEQILKKLVRLQQVIKGMVAHLLITKAA